MFVVLDLFISTRTPKFAILLECSDISIKLIWVPIMYVVVMTYIWIGRSWIFFFLYNGGIVVLHLFISFLGGVPLCIPYGLYSGTSLGGTTWGNLEGYPGRVLSRAP